MIELNRRQWLAQTFLLFPRHCLAGAYSSLRGQAHHRSTDSPLSILVSGRHNSRATILCDFAYLSFFCPKQDFSALLGLLTKPVRNGADAAFTSPWSASTLELEAETPILAMVYVVKNPNLCCLIRRLYYYFKVFLASLSPVAISSVRRFRQDLV